jgi:hypothetical protein
VAASQQQGSAGDLEGATGGCRGAPERWAYCETAQTASGGDVQRWRGSFGGRQRVWRGPVARGRPRGEEAAVGLGTEQLRGALTGRGRTALMLGRSPARRRGFGGGSW